jgi:hypothetical protein
MIRSSPIQSAGWQSPGCRQRPSEKTEVKKLNRYIEWMSGGRQTGRVAYALGARKLPKPVTGAQWQVDSKFNAAEELLREPSLKDVIKVAINNGIEVVAWE